MLESNPADPRILQSDLFNHYRLRDNLQKFSLFKNMFAPSSLPMLILGTVLWLAIACVTAAFAPLPLNIISVFGSMIPGLIPSFVMNSAIKLKVLITQRRVNHEINDLESTLDERELNSLCHQYKLSVSKHQLAEIQAAKKVSLHPRNLITGNIFNVSILSFLVVPMAILLSLISTPGLQTIDPFIYIGMYVGVSLITALSCLTATGAYQFTAPRIHEWRLTHRISDLRENKPLDYVAGPSNKHVAAAISSPATEAGPTPSPEYEYTNVPDVDFDNPALDPLAGIDGVTGCCGFFAGPRSLLSDWYELDRIDPEKSRAPKYDSTT